MIKFCKYCFEHPESNAVGDNGYMPFLYDSDYECPACKNKLEDIDMSAEDYLTIVKISSDASFIQAMINLKESNIIEYQSRMSQFRTQLQQEESAKVQSNNNLPHCPRCGSTSITAGQRGYSLLTGFIGSGKTVNRCSNCGYNWKP